MSKFIKNCCHFSKATKKENEISISIPDCLQIIETKEAASFIAPLFLRRFGSAPPDFPRHFVALYSKDKQHWQAIGYVHYTFHNQSYLCGGLVMDNHLYRRVEKKHREQIAQAGGIAELLLRESFTFLGDCDAIWGYVGDKQAEKVDLRVGFEHTNHPYLMVIWKRTFSLRKKTKMIDEMIRLGAF